MKDYYKGKLAYDESEARIKLERIEAGKSEDPIHLKSDI
jgi:hypothetical protein